MVMHTNSSRQENAAGLQPSEEDTVIFSSDDGLVSYQLRATRQGLWVQRDRLRRESHARLVHSVAFKNADQFTRWCEADSVRFEYPLVSSAVARAGHRLLSRHGR